MSTSDLKEQGVRMLQYDTGVFAVYQSNSPPVGSANNPNLGLIGWTFHPRPSAWVWREPRAVAYKEIWVFPEVLVPGWPRFRTRSQQDRNIQECHYYWHTPSGTITNLATFRTWLIAAYQAWGIAEADLNLSDAHEHFVHERP